MLGSRVELRLACLKILVKASGQSSLGKQNQGACVIYNEAQTQHSGSLGNQQGNSQRWCGVLEVDSVLRALQVFTWQSAWQFKPSSGNTQNHAVWKFGHLVAQAGQHMTLTTVLSPVLLTLSLPEYTWPVPHWRLGPWPIVTFLFDAPVPSVPHLWGRGKKHRRWLKHALRHPTLTCVNE